MYLLYFLKLNIHKSHKILMVQKRYKLVSNLFICVYTACVEAPLNCADVGEHCLCFYYRVRLVRKKGEGYFSINASSLQENASDLFWFLFIVNGSSWFEFWPESGWA